METFILSTIFNSPVSSCLFIVIICCGIISIFSPRFQMKLMLHPNAVLRNKEYYRLITADLVHNNILHLGINLFLLIMYAARLEDYLNHNTGKGSMKFIFIYVFSMIFGNLAVTFINKKDFNYSSAGASGSLIGCMMSYMFIQPNVEGIVVPFYGGINNIISALLIIIAYIIYQLKHPESVVNNELHFFAGVGGILITVIMNMINCI